MNSFIPLLGILCMFALFIPYFLYIRKRPFSSFHKALKAAAMKFSAGLCDKRHATKWLKCYWQDEYSLDPDVTSAVLHVNVRGFPMLIEFGMGKLNLMIAGTRKESGEVDVSTAERLRTGLFKAGYTVHKMQSGLLAEAISERMRKTAFHPKGGEECAASISVLAGLANALGMQPR